MCVVTYTLEILLCFTKIQNILEGAFTKHQPLTDTGHIISVVLFWRAKAEQP